MESVGAYLDFGSKQLWLASMEGKQGTDLEKVPWFLAECNGSWVSESRSIPVEMVVSKQLWLVSMEGKQGTDLEKVPWFLLGGWQAGKGSKELKQNIGV